MKPQTKTIIAIVLISIAICLRDNLMAQPARINEKGDYVAVLSIKDSAGYVISLQRSFKDAIGEYHQLFRDKKGIYWWKKLPNGKERKSYLKLNQP